MNATLRHQLSERTTGAAPAVLTAPCFHLVDGAVGIRFAGGKQNFAFPYSHFLFSELVGADTLVIRFATHRVLICGEQLELLFEELTAQRLTLVRVLPKRQRDQVEGVWIDRLQVSEARAEHTKSED